ncbi:MAG: hypothetical protein AAFU65_03440, partial [Pseudomonadota bacterium]
MSIRSACLTLTACAGITVLAGCSGGGGGGATAAVAGPDSCSAQGQVDFMFNLMNDIYYWIDDVPAVQNVGFNTPE